MAGAMAADITVVGTTAAVMAEDTVATTVAGIPLTATELGTAVVTTVAVIRTTVADTMAADTVVATAADITAAIIAPASQSDSAVTVGNRPACLRV